MTRKKGRQSLDEVVQRVCPLCEGSGRVKEEHVVAADVEQALQRLKRDKKTTACAIRVHPLVGSVLIGQGGRHLQQLEQQLGLKLFIRGDGSLRPDLFFIQQYDDEALAWAEAVPVSRGETYSVLIETQHHDRLGDGIARINGFVIEVSGAGERVGQQVRIRVDELYKTHAHATLVAEG
ncbi:MAG: TRAM domain-containing protein [Firmicutes bacterium]|nr:TRAM domain-containing protein [Bacillota bacterium]